MASQVIPDVRTIRPTDGIEVRDPTTHLHIDRDGVDVLWSPYWDRRLLAGDIMLVTPTPEQSAALEAAEETE